jgi:nucleoside-diphosphate-sugar epimerase
VADVAAVTGLTGFLGPYVARALEAGGYEVRGVVRRADAVTQWPTRVAPLDDGAALRRALDGASVVVHLAGRAHQLDDRASDPLSVFRAVNVAGTRALMEAGIAAGAGRFVLASSVKAAGESAAEPLTEARPPTPLDPYGVSKLEAEQALHAMASTAGVRATALRLPLVYGAGVKANLRRLFALVDRGWPLPLGAVRNRRSLAYAGNVADAIVALLATAAAAGETLYVSDGTDVSTPELIRAIAAALGRPARLLPVPPAAFRAAGRVGDLLARALPTPLTSAAVDRLLGSLAVDSGKLRRLTGWAPRFTLEDGLRDTAAWYRATVAPR